jgi:hypothetical protein
MIGLRRQFLAAFLTLTLAIPASAIGRDPSGMNGAISYLRPGRQPHAEDFHAAGVSGRADDYNTNDQISVDTYDNAGNTTASNALGYVYDFENHLVQAGAGITIVYDGDGNRASKTVAGVTTAYLVDSFNPTGYAQVVYEGISGSTAPNREQSHTFSYGWLGAGQRSANLHRERPFGLLNDLL